MFTVVLVSILGAPVAATVLLLFRISVCLPRYRRKSPIRIPSSVNTMIFWGSGGHTMEMLRLLANFQPCKYSPVHFVASHSDQTSEGKIMAAKLAIAEKAVWHRISRSREVKQSWITTVWTTALTILDAATLLVRERPGLIICNGPGTCVPLCYVGFLLRCLGYCAPQIVFVESFCRVESLSLTGRLLLPIADRFVVQWPQLQEKYSSVEYIGRIC